jgi:hypothetical protein
VRRQDKECVFLFCGLDSIAAASCYITSGGPSVCIVPLVNGTFISFLSVSNPKTRTMRLSMCSELDNNHTVGNMTDLGSLSSQPPSVTLVFTSAPSQSLSAIPRCLYSLLSQHKPNQGLPIGQDHRRPRATTPIIIALALLYPLPPIHIFTVQAHHAQLVPSDGGKHTPLDAICSRMTTASHMRRTRSICRQPTHIAPPKWQ